MNQESLVIIESLLSQLDVLRSSMSSDEEKKMALESVCGTFFRLKESDRDRFMAVQGRVIEMGLAQELCSCAGLVGDNSSRVANRSHEESALHCLKWVVLDNPDTCAWFVNRSEVIDSLTAKIKDMTTPSKTEIDEFSLTCDEAVLRLVNTFSRSLHQAHESVGSALVGPIIQLLKSPGCADQLKLQCVNNMMILSSNPKMTSLLTTACEPLAKIAKSEESRLNSIGALIAVINISFQTTEPKRTEEPPDEFGLIRLEFLQPLKDVLSQTLNGDDYPKGSCRFYTLWSVCQGIENICRSQAACEILYRLSMLKLLKRAIAVKEPRAQAHARNSIDLIRSSVHIEVSPSLKTTLANKLKIETQSGVFHSVSQSIKATKSQSLAILTGKAAPQQNRAVVTGSFEKIDDDDDEEEVAPHPSSFT